MARFPYIRKILAALAVVALATATLLPYTTKAAPTVGTTTTSSSASFSHTVSSGVELLVVILSAQSSGGSVNCSVSYNSVAMSVAANSSGPVSNTRQTAIFYMVNPPSGSHGVSASCSSLSAIRIAAVDVDFDELDTSDPVGFSNATESNESTINVSVEGESGIVFAEGMDNNSISFAGGETSVHGGNAAFFKNRGGYEIHSGSDISIAWSNTTDESAVAEFKEASPASPSGTTIMMGMVAFTLPALLGRRRL